MLIWVSVYIIYSFMMSYTRDYRAILLTNISNVSLFMAAYYLLRYVQIPLLYDRGKMLSFVLSLIASSLALCAICRVNGILWMDNVNGKTDDIPFITPASYVIKTVRFYSPALALIAWELQVKRRDEINRIHQLEKEKMANELKYLKAQINPHFLFNTLNNLYSYVVNQSPKAPDMVMKLSGILDYILYKSQKHEVPLHEELETIKHFLGLEQIRYGDRLKVEFNYSDHTATMVSPLILLSIVENAFKHGASGDIDNPEIKINIDTQNNQVYCRVWNTKSSHLGELNDAYKEGIGLKNIKRQLNLVYPENHELIIEDNADSFLVDLKINSAA